MNNHPTKTKRLIFILSQVALILGAMMLSDYSLAMADNTIIFVDVDASAGGNGQNWENAYQHLQDALDEAETGGGNYEIWVAEGIYTPTLETSTGDPRSATFTLLEGVSIYGGFIGTENSRSQRDWENHITILSGDLGGDDLTDPNGVVTDTANIVGDNAYHILVGGGVSEAVILDGFTITAGQANGESDDDYNAGGGMININSSPTLTNMSFVGNLGNFGGGMFNYINSNPRIISGGFYNNTATYGGGVLNDGSDPIFTDVTFDANFADTHGGGVYNFKCSSSYTNVTFERNKVTSRLMSGGGMFNHESSVSLTNVSFFGNTGGQGGGMYNHDSTPSLAISLFHDNTALEGGGVYNDNSDTTFSRVSFLGNNANYDGGGIYNESSAPDLMNVLFSGNSAGDYGGGVFMTGPYDKPKLINVTLSGNDAGANGGGLSNYGNQPTLINTVFWGNTAPISPQIHNSNVLAIISYSDIQGCGGSGEGWNSDLGLDKGGNIDDNPLFVNANGPDNIFGTLDDNLRLSAPTKAIDAGDNTALPTNVTTDLEGNPRFIDIAAVQDTGNGTYPYVDMGAYEKQSSELYVFLPLITK